MTTQTIAARIVIRRDTAAAWTAANPVLLNGEWGFETDARKLKIGDGTSAWSALAYYSTGSGGGNTILSGSGAPSGALGVNGDIYLDTAATRLYGPKTAGSWGSGVSLIGPAGSTGATGSAGATGATGAAGSAATISVGSVTTGAAGSSASVTNAGTSSAAVLNFTIPRGDTGATGSTGATGATGAAGSAATVSVGSVTTGAAGSSASVTNTGTSGAAVFAFTIPRGDTGATGATGSTGPAGPVAGTTGQLIYNNAGSAGGLTPLGLAISGSNLATLADLVIPLSDETSALTASSTVAKVTIPYWPRATVLTDLPIWAVATAPTGAALQFDIQVGGTSIYLPASGGTYPTIAISGTNSTSSAGTFTTAFAAAPTIAVGSSVSFFVRQIGSTVAGAGLKVIAQTRRAG